MALNHPDAVQAIHINMFLALPPDSKKAPEKFARYQKNDYSNREVKNLERTSWFATEEVSLNRSHCSPFLTWYTDAECRDVAWLPTHPRNKACDTGLRLTRFSGWYACLVCW